jgi:hypothetical protein
MSAEKSYKTPPPKPKPDKKSAKLSPEEQEKKDLEQIAKASDEVPPSPADEPSSKPKEAVKHGKTGRSPMLVFEWRKGLRRAFAYAYLLQAEMTGKNGDDTINLDFGFCQVVLNGRNLQKQFDEITSHHAELIPENEPGAVKSRQNGVLNIEVVSPKKDTPRELPM